MPPGSRKRFKTGLCQWGRKSVNDSVSKQWGPGGIVSLGKEVLSCFLVARNEGKFQQGNESKRKAFSPATPMILYELHLIQSY